MNNTKTTESKDLKQGLGYKHDRSSKKEKEKIKKIKKLEPEDLVNKNNDEIKEGNLDEKK